MLLKTLSLACAAVLAATVNAQTDSGQVSVLEPPQNKLMLGVWLDTNPNQDTPKAFNQRFGRNAVGCLAFDCQPIKRPRSTCFFFPLKRPWFTWPKISHSRALAFHQSVS